MPCWRASSTSPLTAPDPLVRESAVAALGAIGDQRGLDAVLHGTTDRPGIRRRAVLALAAFDDERADTALHSALTDRDWQVRQAAEDVLRAMGADPTST
jgi:HEAT repeat protein